MRQNPHGGYCYQVAAATAVTAAPTLATDGASIVLGPNTHENHVPDALQVAALFVGGTSAYVVVVPYLYFPDLSATVAQRWVPGKPITLGDVDYDLANDTSAVASIFMDAGATRVYLRITTYGGAPTSVTLNAYPSEQRARV